MKRFKKRRDADFGARYKVSDVTLNKHRRCESVAVPLFLFFFSSGEDVEIQHVCSCVLYAQRGSEFFDL